MAVKVKVLGDELSGRLSYCDVVIPRAQQDELTYSWLGGQEVRPGDGVRVTLRGRPVVGVVFGLREGSPVKRTLAVSEVVRSGLLTREMLDLARWIARDYCSRLGEVLGRLIPRGVERAAFISHVLSPMPGAPDSGRLPPGVWVSGRMRGRYEWVVDQLSANLTQGSVLLLLPQSELGRWVPLLKERFPGVIVEYHAGMRATELRHAWATIRWSRCRLVVGVRSAVLAPIPDLAAVVMVDEHDPGYKEERQPRFHSREVAVWRTNRAGCPLLIVDRTPSLETWRRLRAGEYRWLEPPEQPVAWPRVFIVDMRRHRRELVSPRLTRELERIRHDGTSAILYINRLGLSRCVVCETCGRLLACEGCEVPLVLSKGVLRCRYCGRGNTPPDRCSYCQGSEFAFRAAGSEMFVRKLRLLLGSDSVRVAEITSATAVTVPEKGTFCVGTSACLIRPWPKDTALVAALNIDSELALPDFRSRERVFQTLQKLCWRAQENGARVVVQTYRPEELAISAAVEDRVEEFVETELASRREAGFPPYVRLVQFRLLGKQCKTGLGRSDRLMQLAESLKRIFGQKRGCQVLGPVLSPDGSVVRLLVKMPLGMCTSELITPFELERLGVKVRVDVDPLALS